MKPISIAKEKADKIDLYIDNILLWQKSINLISKKHTQRDLILDRHVNDSLQLLTHINNYNKNNNKNLDIYDIGSGAGLPGMVLAIYDSKNNYYLVESNTKKATFLLNTAYDLKLDNVKVINERIEDLDYKIADIVVSRAMASLKDLYDYSKKIINKNGISLFLKGASFNDEINKLKHYINNNEGLNIKTFPSSTHESSAIIQLSFNE